MFFSDLSANTSCALQEVFNFNYQLQEVFNLKY